MSAAEHANGSTIALRAGMPEDAAAISALVSSLTQRWIAPDCTAEGAEVLLASMSPEATTARLREGHRYVLALRGDELVGVAALRLPAHLYHLFVVESAQRQGVARRLWQAARALAPDASAPVTVNASRHAHPAYVRMGFVDAGPQRHDRGIVSIPMIWQPSTPDSMTPD